MRSSASAIYNLWFPVLGEQPGLQKHQFLCLVISPIASCRQISNALRVTIVTAGHLNKLKEKEFPPLENPSVKQAPKVQQDLDSPLLQTGTSPPGSSKVL